MPSHKVLTTNDEVTKYSTIDNEAEDINASIVSDVLLKSQQSLTSDQQAQVQNNIGLTPIVSNVVLKTTQVLSDSDKMQILNNLGILLARNITISTNEPTSSEGNDGDIWLTYSQD